MEFVIVAQMIGMAIVSRNCYPPMPQALCAIYKGEAVPVGGEQGEFDRRAVDRVRAEPVKLFGLRLFIFRSAGGAAGRGADMVIMLQPVLQSLIVHLLQEDRILRFRVLEHRLLVGDHVAVVGL